MGFLSWVQNKISKGKEKKNIEADFKVVNCTSNHETRKEEFVDWPQGLFAIGTFGNKEPQRGNSTETSHSSQELPDLSTEEVIKLQHELKKLLTYKPKSCSGAVEKGGDVAYLQLNRFLNCPSSLEVDQTSHRRISCDLDDENDGNLSPKSKIILKKARELLSDKQNAITRRSISFLLKKMFVCAGGFGPTRSLRDPNMESRMEKLLRTILHKKIYPQNSAPASTGKYLEKNPVEEISYRDEYLEKNPVEEISYRDEYLEKNPVEETSYRDELQENEEERSKWVNTDSEFIVLEIETSHV